MQKNKDNTMNRGRKSTKIKMSSQSKQSSGRNNKNNRNKNQNSKKNRNGNANKLIGQSAELVKKINIDLCHLNEFIMDPNAINGLLSKDDIHLFLFAKACKLIWHSGKGGLDGVALASAPPPPPWPNFC